MKEIYKKLSEIQKELKAPKNLYNSFGKYSYRNAEGILEAVKPMLNGLALIINDEPVLIGNRFYIKATVTLTDGDESVSAVAYAREDEQKKGMDGCQITGACSSYARKYALNALLMIDDAKDSDDDSLSPKNPKNKEKDEDKELPPPESDSKPFTPPKQTGNVKMEKVDKAPEIQKTDAQKYVAEALKKMQIDFGIKDGNEMMKKFIEMRAGLINAQIIKDVKSDKQTLQEAEDMIQAMYDNFSPRRADK